MADYGEIVRVHYAGKLDDGREFESTRRTGEPLEVKIGSGRLLPAVEKALCNMLPGDHVTLTLSPEQAYGDYDESLVLSMDSSKLPNAESLPVGKYIDIKTARGVIRAKVLSVTSEEIVLDCNHELAGHSITFDLDLLTVIRESAIERELHPEGCACGCHKLKEQIG